MGVRFPLGAQMHHNMSNNIKNKHSKIVITDFDGTLSEKLVNGQKVPGLISVLMSEPGIDKNCLVEYEELFNKYHPYEQDINLTLDQKQGFMLKWWVEVYSVLKKYKVTEKMIMASCDSPLVQLRSGVKQFFDYCNNLCIPIIIFSANGIGYNTIEYILKKNDISLTNVRICANILHFDANGQYASTKLPIIHSANKIGETLIKNDFVAPDQDQTDCVLIGDNIDDLKMSEGINFNNVIRVGFGDHASVEFTQNFDYVLPIDAGFEEITGKLNSQ